ncbi:MAG: DNA mismatch repair protein MutS [Candidatus Thermoplasmatota archaeon]|nr:DNA mismatch repair protein MutS [Candidatus Thermoplasmatota archaeon]
MIPDVKESDLTPLMRQYLSIKKQYPDMILFFRMGDFYEMFFEDAEVASRELDLTLTARDKGPYGGKIPLAGIPYHALDSYLPKMVRKGYKVVIAEQVEDPKKAKGLVKREVVQIVTPGTLLLPQGQDEKGNMFLSALVRKLASVNETDLPLAEEKGQSQERVVLPKASYGLAHLDISTGDFFATEISSETPFQSLISELMKFSPAELIVPASLAERKDLINELRLHLGGGCAITAFPDHQFLESYSETVLKEQFNVLDLKGLGLEDMELGKGCAGAVLAYARENQMCDLQHIRRIRTYTGSEFMVLDTTTLRNLEVIRSVRDGSSKGTLLEVLDHTRTAMGARLLRNWIHQPLMDIPAIQERLDAVQALFNDLFLRSDIKDALKRIADLERIIMRMSLKRANARDLMALRNSLTAASDLRAVLEGSDTSVQCGTLKELASRLADLGCIVELIDRAITEEPPLSVREGGLIKAGYSSELDEISSAARDSKKWLRGFEADEKRRTGIRSLKVKHNSVFGYYIEVTKANLEMIPENYVRKQTLVNAERFITPELKEKESIILNSQERMVDLEFQIFGSIVDSVLEHREELQETASAIASIDVLDDLADVASRRNYKRPAFNNSGHINLKRSRHPVIEDKVEWGFVPNDIHLDVGDERFMILTGPNMAGKSTYMRQVALITIMAQMGSFVPAEAAEIGVVDRIFTRVGASDDLSRGQSTFMVEMLELANILNSATKDSLILLDEIGRGTSTFDGLAIAWAVTEFIADRDKVGAKTIFATHYHHLTELEGTIRGLVNYSMAVKEDVNGITFLRKVVKGPASRSYGVEVADLAGIPKEVVERARELLQNIEKEDVLCDRTQAIATGNGVVTDVPKAPSRKGVQMVLFPTEDMLIGRHEDPMLDEIRSMDPNNMTPMQALEAVYRLKKRMEEGG